MTYPNHPWTVHKFVDGEWVRMGRFVTLERAERFMRAVGADAIAARYEE